MRISTPGKGFRKSSTADAATFGRSSSQQSLLPFKNFRFSKAGKRAGAVMRDENKKYIADSIRGIPDYPHQGILFHDVTTLLLDPKVCILDPAVTMEHQNAL